MITSVLVLVLSLAAPGLRIAPTARPLVEEVGAIGIVVGDLDRAVEFYTGVLAFERSGEREDAGSDQERLTGLFGVRVRSATLRLGDESIVLSEFLAPEGRAVPADTRGNDRWFQHIAIVVSDMDAAYRHLRRHKVRHASSGPQRLPDWNREAGGIEAFYFKDPDGHHLELIHFPPGKGEPKWQASSPRGGLFLGIDHTAIVVRDTDASLMLYRDQLGLRVAGTAENHGVEQEHLNNVFGARVRITALRAERGPGIELLEYLAPSDGRDHAYPDGAPRANDLVSWHICLHTRDPGAAFALGRAGPARMVSAAAAVVGEHDGSGLFRLADPDRHLLQFHHGDRP